MEENFVKNELINSLRALLDILKLYGGSENSVHISQINNILSILSENEFKNEVENIKYFISRLYIPKAGLGEFYVTPSITENYKEVNKRISEINRKLHHLIKS